jgi:mannose/fructose-specific phosphotransferase system component IIA
VASHGTFASGMKSSLNILLGKSDNVTVIDAYLDQDDLDKKLDEYFQSIPESEQVIMLSDLYGGSVNQKMCLRLTRLNTFLIAGINLALVLEIALKTEPLNLEQLEAIVKDSREALRIVEIPTQSVEEDDFFGGS